MPKLEDKSPDVIVPSPRPAEAAARVPAPGELPAPTWLTDLRKRVRRPRGEVPALTDQFLATLRAYATEVEQRAGGQSSKPLDRVRLLLGPANSDQGWLDAYEVEQQLVHLMSPELLEVELEARLTEAKALLRPERAQAYQDLASKEFDEARARGLLGRLVNDLQWTYTVNEAKREFWRRITSWTARFFAACAGLFVLFMWLTLWAPFQSRFPTDSQGNFVLETLSWRTALLALSAGAWGASFSMLIGLKRVSLEKVSLEQLKVMSIFGVFVARVCIGAGGALVFLFFLVSGLLSGQVFPTVAGASVAGTQIALLIVWCFVAGFSEKLVTGLLSHTEQRGSGAGGERQPGDVVRPSAKVEPPAKDEPES